MLFLCLSKWRLNITEMRLIRISVMAVMYFKCQNNSLLFKVSIKLPLVSLITSADVRESLFSATDVGFGDIVSSSIDDGCRSMTVQRIKGRIISNWNQ